MAAIVCETIQSLPFGDGMSASGSCSDASPMHFTGKQRDWETNLDDFDARFYGSQLGRFMSADWSAVPAPVPYANLSNPQTLNLYAIVSDNPGTFADLDGHSYTAPTGGNGMDLTGAVTDLGGELGGFGELEIGDQYQTPASETQAHIMISYDVCLLRCFGSFAHAAVSLSTKFGKSSKTQLFFSVR